MAPLRFLSWRHDPLTGRTVRIAAERAARPSDFAAGRHARRCPFCAGAEDDTPAESERVDDAGGDWLARCVPNLYPVVSGDDGAHEVLVESPRHATRFVDLTDAEAMAAVTLWARRVRHWRADERFAYRLMFKNEGPAAGASLEHVHSQVVALPVTPPEVAAMWRRVGEWGAGAWGEPVHSADGVEAIAPPAPRDAGEVWLRSADGAPFDAMADDPARARALMTMLRKVLAATGAGAFNLVLQTPPADVTAPLPWWLELLPRSSALAGFELATGWWINSTPPEAAAERLQEGLNK